MYFLLFILLLLSLFVYLSFYKAVTLHLLLNTNENDLHLWFYWLYPLIKAKLEPSDYSPHLTVYLFNVRVYSKTLRKKSKKRDPLQMLNYARAADLYNISLTTSYGFLSPAQTGLLGGVFAIVGQYFGSAEISQYPCYLAGEDFIIIDAAAQLNVAKTLIAFLRLKKNSRVAF